MNNSTYFCYNLVDLCDEINAPLRQTQRIQYNCLDASSNYVVLGASSGSIYLFRRTNTGSVQFLQIIQNMYGPINHVAISPQEKFVTFSTTKGTICVYVIDLAAAYPQIVTAHYADTPVTCLHWRRNESQLFYGDQKGTVCLVNLTSFLGRNLTNISIHPILFLDTPIVQISDLDKLLLVSNYTKCILCNTDTEQFKQIGNTPRDGYYGACFLPAVNKNHLADAKVFCARPGSRLWEADVEGRVLQTTQYRVTTAAAPPPPTPNVNGSSAVVEPPNNPNQEQQQQPPDNHLNKPPQLLHRLQPIHGRFIFSYNRNGFYIVDPQRTGIVLCNDQIRDIQSVHIVNGTTLLIFTHHRQVFSVSCRSLEDGFVDMLANRRYLSDAMQLLQQHVQYFRELCLTQGYSVHIQRLSQLVRVRKVPGADEFAAMLLREFGELVQSDDNAKTADGSSVVGVHTVDNRMLGNGGVQMRQHATTTPTNNANTAEETIRTVLMSASRNIFNKFNIFIDSPTPSVVESVATSARPQRPDVSQQRASSPAVIVPSAQRADEILAQPIVLRTSLTRRRPSSVPPAPPAATASQSQPFPPTSARQTRRRQQHQQQQQPVIDDIALDPRMSTEERLLQNLYMIRQSARMSSLSLVERYAAIFDKYDGAGLRELLAKLATVMQANGCDAERATAECYEMYFNYLRPELVVEMDDAQREYVLAGFVLVNRQLDGNDLERCERCAYPLCLPAERAQQARFRELGEAICRYFWTTGRAQRGFELAVAVPWTMELCCKFQLQQLMAAAANHGDNVGGDNNDGRLLVERRLRCQTVRNLFACGSAELLQLAVDQTDERFTVELWHQFAELLLLLHGQSRMWCAKCEVRDDGDGAAAPAAQSINSEALQRNEFYAWSRLLDHLVQHIRGRNAIALIRRLAGRIGADVIPKEFYLKCLLVP